MSNPSKFVYALVFQVGWFVCIMAGSLTAFIYTLAFLTFHFWFVLQKNVKVSVSKEILWLLIISSIGLVIEVVSFSNALLYQNANEILLSTFPLPPLWLFCIWIMFTLALRTCLAFLFQKPALSYLLLFIFVPINYYAGAELNEHVHLAEPYLLSLSLITLMWILFWWFTTHLKKIYFEELFNAN